MVVLRHVERYVPTPELRVQDASLESFDVRSADLDGHDPPPAEGSARAGAHRAGTSEKEMTSTVR